MRGATLFCLLAVFVGCSWNEPVDSNLRDAGDASSPPLESGTPDGDAGSTDGGDGGDGGLAKEGEPCGAQRACAPGLGCRFGTGPDMFTGTCRAPAKEGEPCVVNTPGGNFDCFCCATGLVCDLQANRCKIP